MAGTGYMADNMRCGSTFVQRDNHVVVLGGGRCECACHRCSRCWTQARARARVLAVVVV